jgi:hypothetical protein
MPEEMSAEAPSEGAAAPEGAAAVEPAAAAAAEGKRRRKRRWETLVEVVEVIVLAIVAVATSWTGYSAARWDGRQSLLYGHASTDRFKADAASTRGGQELVADSSMFTAYLQAHAAGDTRLATVYVRRFTPDYRAAFAAWLTTSPFTNPAAPPGPGYMPQYHNPYLAAADRLNAAAAATFDQGSAARDNAERYLQDTVLFATVLFVVAIAQRFKVRAVRVTTTVIALGLAAYTTAAMLTLPRV